MYRIRFVYFTITLLHTQAVILLTDFTQKHYSLKSADDRINKLIYFNNMC